MTGRLFSARERRALAIYSGFKCEICRAPLERYEADHVRPFSKGGETDVRNGQSLCPSCNRKKGSKYVGS